MAISAICLQVYIFTLWIAARAEHSASNSRNFELLARGQCCSRTQTDHTEAISYAKQPVEPLDWSKILVDGCKQYADHTSSPLRAIILFAPHAGTLDPAGFTQADIIGDWGSQYYGLHYAAISGQGWQERDKLEMFPLFPPSIQSSVLSEGKCLATERLDIDQIFHEISDILLPAMQESLFRQSKFQTWTQPQRDEFVQKAFRIKQAILFQEAIDGIDRAVWQFHMSGSSCGRSMCGRGSFSIFQSEDGFKHEIDRKLYHSLTGDDQE